MTQIAVKALNALGYPEAGLQLNLVDEQEISRLHADLFDDPSSTNVISLEYGVPPAFSGDLVGEVFVCLPVAMQEAEIAEEPVEIRAAELLVHGILHVCGHEHVGVSEAQRQAMESEEERLRNEVILPAWEVLSQEGPN